jgi:hypothetical protein
MLCLFDTFRLLDIPNAYYLPIASVYLSDLHAVSVLKQEGTSLFLYLRYLQDSSDKTKVLQRKRIHDDYGNDETGNLHMSPAFSYP